MQNKEKDVIQLSDHFTYGRLIRFVIPSIVMMIFTSIYGVVDGLFVSNFVGKTPFAALNLIMPAIMIMGAVGFMIGTGGSALVAKTLGEGDRERADRYFTMMIMLDVIAGVLLAVLGNIFIEPMALLLGADEVLLPYCVLYGRITLCGLPAFMLQNVFQSFLITAEKPKLGLAVTVAAGCTNIILDLLLVGIFPMGLAGAALATAISQLVGGVIPLIYFLRPNKSLLRLTRTRLEVSPLLKACANGSSELMSNISMSLVGILYNYQLMSLAGENGVAAYGVIMYVNFIFVAFFIGYSIGAAPIIGYHYGALNSDELKSLRKKSLVIVGITGLVMTVLAEVLAAPLSALFVGYDAELFELTRRGFMLYSLSFLICGINIFGSAFFTALNNGLISAILSFVRTLVFQVAALFILPLFMQVDGIFFSIVAAEILAAAMTIVFIVAKRKKYGY
ncbi:MAG: MATE family efflux transporter [Oscillospiraceae bacterium]|nr:MATE family efflux transporter [Oscillospiraceae bacterium]